MQISRFISFGVIKSYSLLSSGMPVCLSACALHHLLTIFQDSYGLRLMSTVSSCPYKYIWKKIMNKSRTILMGTQC